MATPTRSTQRYIPALDGLRAFAVAAVMAYHLDYGWASGGYLGVDLFFVLSGFLITGMIIGERESTGGVGLRAFWGRRARRLLPALLLLLVVLAAYSAVGSSGIDRSGLRQDSLATLFYFANWHAIFAHQSYFAQFATPSPLMHTWSLAIEEQFYVLWPLALVAIFGVARHAHAAARKRALVLTLVLAAASAALMALLYHPGSDPSRVYYGTDTRAFELLVGAALAMVLQGRPEPGGRARLALHAAGMASAAVLVLAWISAGGPPQWMFQGGMLAGCVLAAVVIASVSQPHPGPLGAFLSFRPIRWVGKISYGLYLWHWPVFVLVTDTTTGLSGPSLAVVRIGTTFAVATASFYLLERPLRRADYSGWKAWVAAPTGFAVTASAVVLATLPVTSTAAAAAAPVAVTSSASVAAGSGGAPQAAAATDPFAMAAGSAAGIKVPPGRVISASDPLRVMIIGDSVMWDAEPGVAAALEATGEVKIDNLSFPGWGLTRTDSWRTDWPRDIQSFRPDLVLGMWSWDDPAALANPTAYSGLVNQALQVLLAPGSSVSAVAFLQFPKSGPDQENPNPVSRAATVVQNEKGRDAWNAVVSGLAPLWPGRVAFLPVAGSLELNGHFATWLPQPGGTWVRVRKIDGEHLCPTGAALLGQAVLTDLSAVYHLAPAAPGWWSGGWTRDTTRYTSQNCPDDQPPPGYSSSLAASDSSSVSAG